MADESGCITHIKTECTDVVIEDETGPNDLSSFNTAVTEEPGSDSGTQTDLSGELSPDKASTVIAAVEELIDYKMDDVGTRSGEMERCGDVELSSTSERVETDSDFSEDVEKEDGTETMEYVGHMVDVNISKRRRICGEKMPFSCSECRYSSRNKAHLRNHMRVHTGEKPHICDVCGTRFSQTSHLKTHKRIHSGERPHTCDVCGSKFSEGGALKAHWRIHSGEKPYACDFCGARYSRASDLKIHTRYHTGEKPYACDVCESRFSRASDLKRHTRIHSEEKPHVCDVCNSRFSQSGHLQRHKKTHGEEKP